MLGSSKRNAQRESKSAGDASATQSSAHLSLARFDGNRDPIPTGPAPQLIEGISNNVKNIDLGAGMWSDARGARNAFQGRQPASKLGREVNIQLNAFAVTALPVKPIYQYQVMVGTGAEKRGLIKAVWNSQATRKHLGAGWIFDGQSLAWSSEKKSDEIRFNVNLDDEAGHKARPGRTDVHRVILRLTAAIDFTTLTAYLNNQAAYDKKILQAITVLDHIMRENPSNKFISIKRSFFAATSQRSSLGGHVEHTTGVYQSLRIAHHPGGHRLVVNADVANGTFWSPGPVSRAVVAVTRLRDESEIARLLAPNNQRWYDLRRLKKLRVFAAHRKGAIDDYVIDSFLKQDSSHVLNFKDGSKKTVKDYFQQTHNIRLQYPNWPVVQMTKKNSILPLELLKIKENQRYTFKLDEVQTSNMIKKAVTPPKDRWAAISAGVNMINWSTDPSLAHFGMFIQQQPIAAKARLLTNPKLQFGGTGSAAQADPRTSGRWDLKGKKFASIPPPAILNGTWGVCVVPGRFHVDKAAIDRFVKSFFQAYGVHGASLPQAYQSPAIHYPSNPDPATFAQETFTVAGNKYKLRPQILMFILMDKNSFVYGKIKRFCECKLGIPSQCVQYAHVQKAQPQYISNVLMKFNAKLGGFTNTAFTPQTAKGILDNTTVVIGADVSHSAPGLKGPSMAAMTVSMNLQGTRYAAAVETNGYRVEMITDENIEKHIMSLIKNGWVNKVGQGRAPATVLYFRDGVSEGQFAQVIDQEVAAMKKAFLKMFNSSPKFLVVIASKRHHVRFFPQSGGDKNGNALPGTLVETGVTQPYENDFYLCAHAAIKGTARPVHYNVLLNEPQWPNEKIQTLIYEHSYQYIRATTPVSIFPAVYYAHIASLRGAHHSKGFGVEVDQQSTIQGPSNAGSEDPVFPPLLPMANPATMNPGMWYI
ncbi:unnamed protein product [Aureobasidium uvarum]|uniref:Piwi-domain-containing protein n=1 Tax=Aureobasidium uvarum TaxID=2773716 RepID=A0A9N8PQ12_9PEZI|nr:unnamed protein product [Aureobasidium uvarum]